MKTEINHHRLVEIIRRARERGKLIRKVAIQGLRKAQEQ